MLLVKEGICFACVQSIESTLSNNPEETSMNISSFATKQRNTSANVAQAGAHGSPATTRSLLALAIMVAFTGAASAQSSVEIWGLVDVGLTKSNGGNTFNPGVVNISAGAGSPAAGVVDSTGARNPAAGSKAWLLRESTGSRLGFRGTEDLGGGNSVHFNMETRFSLDDGQAAARFWVGRSLLQLDSKTLGSLYAGREYAPWFWLAAKSDAFGLDGVGQFALMSYALGGTHETVLSANGIPLTNGGSKTQNMVGYKSPSFAGLTVNASVGLGEKSLPGGHEGSFNVEYAPGKAYAAIGFNKKKGGQPSSDGNSMINAALHYDFGIAKLMGYAARSETGVGNVATNKYYGIGVQVPVGPGIFKAGFGSLDVPGSNHFLDVKKYAVGYNYNLSKRTNLYVDFSVARSDFSGDKNTSAFAIGVRHKF